MRHGAGEAAAPIARVGGFSSGDTVYNTATGSNVRVRVEGDFVYIGDDMFYGHDIAGEQSFIGSLGTQYRR